MTTQANAALPSGFRLDTYTIERKIGGGGFSFVYLARDADGARLAIKEYFPSALVEREVASGEVRVRAPDQLALFRHGLKCFFEEGRALASIDHPNVVRVVNFFRANETVYMVMRYERGKTLQQQIRAHHGGLGEKFVRRVFGAVLNGLREVHAHRLLHLDIKPSNLYLRLDGSPLLIDFGAVRQTLAAEESRLQPMYTPGYAAPEQYHNRERLGPWTDIYSVGASLYACLSGQPPQPADERLVRDRLVPARVRWAGMYSAQLLETIDASLKLNYLDRPQSVYTLQKTLLDDSMLLPAQSGWRVQIRRLLARALHRS